MPHLLYHATLSLPPSISHGNTYAASYSPKLGRTVFYMTARAKAWKTEAETLLRGWKRHPLPAGTGGLDVRIVVTCSERRDIDAGIKLTLDALCEALDTDDKHILTLSLRKVAETHRAAHGLDVTVQAMRGTETQKVRER